MSKLAELGKEVLVGQLSDPESELRSSFSRLDEALSELYKKKELSLVTELDELLAKLPEPQRDLFRALNVLDPGDYGISASPHEGLEPVPETVVVEFVSAVEKDDDGNFKKSYQHVPVHVHAALTPMNEAFMADHPDRKLKIVSAYRSPAFQLYIFVRYLVHIHDFDIIKTFQRVALPTYSQHCLATHTALDIANVDGKPSEEHPEDFEGTIECIWLRERAAEFDFYESYPPDNPYGIMPESWHWQYQGATA